jgi:hypothetical protein
MKFKVTQAFAGNKEPLVCLDVAVINSNVEQHAGRLYMAQEEATRFLEVLRRGSGAGGQVEIVVPK